MSGGFTRVDSTPSSAFRFSMMPSTYSACMLSRYATGSTVRKRSGSAEASPAPVTLLNTELR